MARFGKVLDYEAKDYTKVLGLLAMVVTIGAVVLGFWYEQSQLGYAGLSLIQDILGLPEAILNGFSYLITTFFHWLGGLLP